MRVAAVMPSLLTEGDLPVIIRSLWGNTSVAPIGIETPVVLTVAIVAFVSHRTPDRTQSGDQVCKQFQTLL